jgi:hypothetical protein
MLEKARVDSRLQGSRPGRGGGVMEKTRAEAPSLQPLARVFLPT